jgi:membrane protease YdiL (CAAX protease family)/CheY-like chemotaxis protein
MIWRPGTGTGPAGAPSAPNSQSGREGLRVLVVADDLRVRTSLHHLITSDPSMRAVVDGGERPDVVLVDLVPGAPAELLRMAATSCAPVVALGFDETDRTRAVARGVDAFVTKTAAPEDVLAAVREAATEPHRDNAPTASAADCGTVSGSIPQLLVLVGAVFLGPWTMWLSRVAENRGLLSWHLPQGLALWSIAPVLLLALAAVSGGDGLRDLGRRIVHWRVPGWTYAAALAAPLGIAGSSAAVVHAAGRSVPVGDMLSLPAALIYLAYGTGLFLLTEEAAWRGVLLPRIQRRVGPNAAALSVGALWAGWHLPLLAVPDAGDYGLPVAPFLLLIVATSVLMTGLVNAAGGSVLIAALFHASFDACYSYLGVVGEQHAMIWVAALTTTGLAALLIVGTRHQLFLRKQVQR